MEVRIAPRADTAVDPATVWLGLLVGLACIPAALADLAPNAPRQFDFHAFVFATDLALAAVIAVAIRRRRLPLLAVIAVILLALLAASWLVHPSTRGVLTLFRLGGVAAIASLVDRRRLVAGLLGGWALAECAIALAQKLHDGPLGLSALGEDALTFKRFGTTLSPPGTLVHPYLLAGLALLGGLALALESRRHRWLLAPAALAIAPVGFTYSRAALLGLVLALAALAVARRPAAVLALAIGAGLPALVWSEGWVERAKTVASTSAAPSADFDAGRSVGVRQAADLITSQPLAGVGPGRYVAELRDRGVDPSPTLGLKPVHNVPLLAAAEGGIFAGLAMLALLVAAGVLAVRAGPVGIAVYAAFAPFVLLDHFAYTFPQGMVMFGLWLGLLGTIRVAPAPRPAT